METFFDQDPDALLHSDHEEENNQIDDVAEDDGIIPTQEQPKPKRAFTGFTYKPERLVHDPTGLQNLYRKFGIEQETIVRLRGKGHEASDLNKIVQDFKGWHLTHCPKLEYYYFLEKVQKMGHSDQGVKDFVARLRRHHKGQEKMEEFSVADQLMGDAAASEEGAQPAQSNLKKDGDDQPRKRVQFQFVDDEDEEMADDQIPMNEKPAQAPAQKPQAPGGLTPEQLAMIERNRQIALSKKRTREEMEKQARLEVEALERAEEQVKQAELEKQQRQEAANSNEQVVLKAEEDDDIDLDQLDDLDDLVADEILGSQGFTQTLGGDDE